VRCIVRRRHRPAVFPMTRRFDHGKKPLAKADCSPPNGRATSHGECYSEVAVRTQRAADIAVGCFIALVGIFVLSASTTISVARVHRLSPRTFPYVVGLLLLICGIGLALKSWSLRGADSRIHWPDGEGIRTITVSLVGLACYIALMNPLGLPLATFLYLAFSTWYLNRSRWRMALTIALITGALSYVLFIRLLGLSFPAGSLFE